ncbi:MAG: GFA family protein [Myxococcota bacterium]
MNMAPPQTLHGSCLCGAIAFACSGRPIHFNLCHCTMCQKFHGAMLGPYLWFRQQQYTLLQGEADETIYRSSDWASRSFCRHCGSSFRYIYHKEPELVFIAAGLMDDAFDMRPVRHIFVKDKCAWFDILDDLPQVASWVHSTSGEDIPEPF